MGKEQLEVEPATLMMILSLCMVNPCNDNYDDIYEKCLYELLDTLGEDEFEYEMNSVINNFEFVKNVLDI